MYAFFYQYTALSALNYVSVYFGAIVYGLVMAKFVQANRTVAEPATA